MPKPAMLSSADHAMPQRLVFTEREVLPEFVGHPPADRPIAPGRLWVTNGARTVPGCRTAAIVDGMSAEVGDLAGAIASLRADLESAISEGQGQDVQFGLGDVELTLQLVATKHGGGKVGWSVLGVDAGAQNERTHTVKLTLRPLKRAADGSYSETFAIADRVTTDPGNGIGIGTTRS